MASQNTASAPLTDHNKNPQPRFTRNQQYSITAVSDGGGAVVERYAYSAYGQVTIADTSGSEISGSAISNRYTYTGREWDEGLSLYHYRARMYDAVGGRFCSRDPIGFEGSSWNLYECFGSSPTYRTDPSGLVFGDGPIPAEGCRDVICASCNATAGGNVLLQLLVNGIDGSDDPGGGNAFRHCLASCQSTNACGADCSEWFWDGRETPGVAEDDQDLANKQAGRGNANESSCWDACTDDWENGGLDCQGTTCPPPA